MPPRHDPPARPAPTQLWRGRLRLAGLMVLVMGAILYCAGFGMTRLLLQAREGALERELESLAGTLHDSLKPLLPPEARPSAALTALMPGLCVIGTPCPMAEPWIERHAVSAADPDRYQLRLLDPRGVVVAHSPGASSDPVQALQEGMQRPGDGGNHHRLTYTIHLHRSHDPEPLAHSSAAQEWGYLQISRSLADLEIERWRLWWLGHWVFALAMVVIGLASWWLAGLAMAPLLVAYRQQQQFSADVAHELRAPLANLLALVEAESGSAVQDRVLAQGRRLQRLIADLLLLASLEEPSNRSAMAPCRLAEIAEDLVEEFGETAQAAGIRLELRITDPCAQVLAMESELSRLIANLLSNAIQHSQAGDVVAVTLQRQGAEVWLAVRDCGAGIAPQEQGRIFERFYRSDPARSRRHGGAGLGLAIAQAIARRHRGRLTVRSTPGAGSVFSLQLPVASDRSPNRQHPTC